MKRNQCIICFDRISKSTDRISTSHDTLSKKHIKHDGWYHIECLKEYINYGNKNKIPKCPLCRDDLIIEIPGYNYKIKENENTENLINELRYIVIADAEDNIPMAGVIITDVPNILLVIQFGIRYSEYFYMGVYLYVLYTSFVAVLMKMRNNFISRRENIKRWIFINRVIILYLWLEMIYSVLHYITMRTIHQCDIWFEMEETIEYEIYDNL
jgi:hypothetical protein